MEYSPRLTLPLLSAGQSQKEVLHNEALLTLDLLVPAVVEEGPRNDTPPTPAPGSIYIVGASPTGEWAGQSLRLAGFSAAGWRFVSPVEGMEVWIKSSSLPGRYRHGAWEIGASRSARLVIDELQVVGSQAPAIQAPTDGSTVDLQARAAIGSILDALRQHGLIAT